MDWYVPRLKVHAFLTLARDEIARRPNLSEKEMDVVLGKLWDSVDNRFGQLVYDNLFWKRWVRDMGVVSSLSLGWNLGTIKEFGGGILKDLPSLIANKGLRKTQIADRMLFSIAYPLVVGTIGGLTTYALTGHRPQKLLDYFYPKTGKKNPDGSDERIQLPSMMKEPFSIKADVQKLGLIKGTAQYFWHKTNPTFDITLDLLNNKDFYGVEIRSPYDPAYKQAIDVAKFLSKSGLAPISLSAFFREKQKGENTLLPFAGLNSAPKYITQTPLQTEIFNLYQKRLGGGTRTKEEWQKSQVKSQIRALYLQGKNKEANQKLKEAVKRGIIKQVSRFVKDSDLPTDIRLFRALPTEDQRALVKKMSLSQLKRYAWYTHKDLRPKFGKLSKNAHIFVQLYKSGKVKQPKWKRQRLVH